MSHCADCPSLLIPATRAGNPINILKSETRKTDPGISATGILCERLPDGLDSQERPLRLPVLYQSAAPVRKKCPTRCEI